MAQGAVYNYSRSDTQELLHKLEELDRKVNSLVEELNHWQKLGPLDRLKELGVVFNAAIASLEPGIVARLLEQGVTLIGFLKHLQDLGADHLLLRILEELEEAVSRSQTEPPPSLASLLGTLLRDPEVRKGLGIALSLLRSLTHAPSPGPAPLPLLEQTQPTD